MRTIVITYLCYIVSFSHCYIDSYHIHAHVKRTYGFKTKVGKKNIKTLQSMTPTQCKLGSKN